MPIHSWQYLDCRITIGPGPGGADCQLCKSKIEPGEATVVHNCQNAQHKNCMDSWFHKSQRLNDIGQVICPSCTRVIGMPLLYLTKGIKEPGVAFSGASPLETLYNAIAGHLEVPLGPSRYHVPKDRFELAAMGADKNAMDVPETVHYPAYRAWAAASLCISDQTRIREQCDSGVEAWDICSLPGDPRRFLIPRLDLRRAEVQDRLPLGDLGFSGLVHPDCPDVTYYIRSDSKLLDDEDEIAFECTYGYLENLTDDGISDLVREVANGDAPLLRNHRADRPAYYVPMHRVERDPSRHQLVFGQASDPESNLIIVESE